MVSRCANPFLSMTKFFSKKVYKLPGIDHSFGSRADAEFYCGQHDISTDLIEQFDSTKEYKRYVDLCDMERNGIIKDLRRQVEFSIIPQHTEKVNVGRKAIRQWQVNGNLFNTKREAILYCRRMKIDQCWIKKDISYSDIWRTVVVEKEAVYTADFTYIDKNGVYIVEDVKSDFTRKEKDYILRRKLMLHVYGIKILET